MVSIANDIQFELTRKCLQSKHLINLHLLCVFDMNLTVQHNLSLNKNLNLSMYIINIIHHGKCTRTVLRHWLKISLVRFPILEQLVLARKYRLHTLFMKYSVTIDYLLTCLRCQLEPSSRKISTPFTRPTSSPTMKNTSRLQKTSTQTWQNFHPKLKTFSLMDTCHSISILFYY